MYVKHICEDNELLSANTFFCVTEECLQLLAPLARCGCILRASLPAELQVLEWDCVACIRMVSG